MQTVSLPATISSTFRPYFNQSVRSGVTVVSGRDLVVTEVINRAGASAVARIPLNPRIWSGTRLSVLGGTFMSHKPQKVILHYQPSVGSSTNGNIYWGSFTPDTAFNGANIARTQSLVSTGGGSTPIWCPLSAEVSLTGLQKPWYDSEGTDADSVPLVLYFAVGNVAADAVCGSIWIEYVWEFSRPYVGISSVADIQTYYDMIPRSMGLTNASANVTFTSDPNYIAGTDLTVTTGNVLSVPIYEGSVIARSGNWINAGLDYTAKVTSDAILSMLNDAGVALVHGATTTVWGFFSRAILAAL